jgi:hypothetical protein
MPDEMAILIFTSSVGFSGTIPSARFIEAYAAADVDALFGVDSGNEHRDDNQAIIMDLYHRIDPSGKPEAQQRILEHRLLLAVVALKKKLDLPEDLWSSGWPEHLKG